MSLRSSLAQVRRLYGAMALWRYGSMALWLYGSRSRAGPELPVSLLILRAVAYIG